MTNSLSKFSCLYIIFIFISSCITVKKTTFLEHINKSSCNQENTYNYTIKEIPKPISKVHYDSIISMYFKINEINIANSIGVLDILSDYIKKMLKLKEENTIQNQIDLIKVKQDLYNRIDLASLEISAVTAELDCEEERINQIASYLKEKENKTESKLTVSSIIMGSISAIVTAAIVTTKSDDNTSETIGIGVGIADAIFGTLILTHKRKIELKHTRNVLRELWFASEVSSIYPPSIWYYLNNYNPEKKDKISLREKLINNWKNFEQVKNNKKSKQNSLDIYFGDGGIYSSDELKNRANMYDQIESIIKLMKQDLRNLTSSINNIN